MNSANKMNIIQKHTIPVIAIAFLIFIFWTIYPPLVLSRSEFVGIFSDDAFYYFEVAHRVVDGQGFTFDGRNPTNGFHWAWEFLMILLASVVNDRMLFLILIPLIQGILALSGVFLFYRDLTKICGIRSASIGLLPLVYPRFTRLLFHTGMETSITFFSIVLVFHAMLSLISEPRTKRRYFFAAISMSLLALSRFDYLILLPFVFLVAWKGGLLRTGKRDLPSYFTSFVVLSMPVVLIIAILFTYNFAEFGHILAISGTIKNSFPVPSGNWLYWLEQFPEFAMIAASALVIGPVLLFFATRPLSTWQKSQSFSNLMFVAGSLCLSLSLHFTGTVVFGKWGISSWYFSGYLVIPPLIIAIFYGIFEEKLKISGMVLSFLLVFSLLFFGILYLFIGLRMSQDSWIQQSYTAALWVNENLPANARLGMNDAGAFGYFSQPDVVNLDGVINNFEYQEYLKRGDFNSYLCEQDIGFYVSNSVMRDSPYLQNQTDFITMFSYSRYYDVSGGKIELRLQNEIYRSSPFTYRSDGDVFIIWKIFPTCVKSEEPGN